MKFLFPIVMLLLPYFFTTQFSDKIIGSWGLVSSSKNNLKFEQIKEKRTKKIWYNFQKNGILVTNNILNEGPICAIPLPKLKKYKGSWYKKGDNLFIEYSGQNIHKNEVWKIKSFDSNVLDIMLINVKSNSIKK